VKEFILKSKILILNNTMKVSIIIPTLNRQNDLKNCLKSLENNTIRPNEVILIEQ
jgi:glycosyltransferase involved in cell wall biosynthesis